MFPSSALYIYTKFSYQIHWRSEAAGNIHHWEEGECSTKKVNGTEVVAGACSDKT